MDKDIRSAFFQQVANEGYATKLGLELIEVSRGHAIVELITSGEYTNFFGMVHGGAIFSLMDEAFQVSCNSHGRLAVALCLNVIYHNSPEVGTRLRAESTETHRSGKTATYEIRVTDENDVLIASCQALAYRKKDDVPFFKKNSKDLEQHTCLSSSVDKE